MTIAGRAVQPVLEGLQALGVDSDVLLARLGLADAGRIEPDLRISWERVVAFWEEAVALSGDPAIGLRVAEQVDPRDYELIWYLAKTSTSTLQASEILLNYRRLMADAAAIELREFGDLAWLIHQPAGGVAIPRAAADYVLTALVRLTRALLGDAVPIVEVQFAISEPLEASEYARILGVPIRFGAEHNAVLMRKMIDAPIPTADPALQRLLRRHADAVLARLPSEGATSWRVRELLIEALPGGRRSADETAQMLGMSPRVLRRKLREEGTSYRDLQHGLRRDLAQRLLDDPTLGISEIAYQLGFSEPSAFHRAFKRWCGRTPGEYRRVSDRPGNPAQPGPHPVI